MKNLLLVTVAAFLTFINARAQQPAAPTVIVGLDGVTSVKFNGYFVTWDLEYGPPGFVTGTGTQFVNMLTNTKTITVNPFMAYDIRVRRTTSPFGGDPTWYNFVFSNCTGTTASLDYYQPFSSSPTEQCWRGYNFPNSTFSDEQASYNPNISRTSPGGSIQINSLTSTRSKVVVSPKLSGLSSTKKISFWLRGYQGTGLSVGTISSPYDISTFHELQNVTVTGAQSYNWIEVTVNLDNYNGTDEYIAFKYAVSSFPFTTIYIDDFRFQEQCYSLSNFSLSNVQENSAQLNFTAPEGQMQWEVWLKLFTNIPETILVTSNTAVLQNLVANADYQVKVRAKCADNNFSAWSPTLNFHTPCQPMTADSEYSFEDSGLFNCWHKLTPGGSSVEQSPAYATSTYTMIAPKSGNKMIRMYGGEGYLISRYVENLVSDNRIKFSMISYSNSSTYNGSSLIVGTMSNPADAATFIPLKTITPIEMSEMFYQEPYDYWKIHVVTLENYNPTLDHHYIALKHTAGGTVFIDDFSYGATPSCKEPLNLNFNVQHSLVKLSWTGNAASYQVEYGPEGFVPGTGTLISSNTAGIDITTLPNDNSKYDFYVRSICGTTFSQWSERRRFRTKCEGVTVGYTYGFENDAVNEVNPCWTRLAATNANGSQTWIHPLSYFIATVATGGTSVPIAPHTGSRMIRLSSLDLTLNDQYNRTVLVSPRINNFEDLTLLKFWANFANVGNVTKTFIIGTMSNPDDYTTFEPFTTFSVTSADQNQWKEYTVDFSSYQGNNKYFAIKHGPQSGNKNIYFDDFRTLEFACPTINSLAAYQTGANSATLSWQDNTDTAPTAYEILIDGQTITTTNNPYTINNLEMYGHTFKVRNVCSPGVYGEWSQPYSFRISCPVTAPFVENFDSYLANAILFDEDWCWTQYEYEHTQVVTSCIDNLNSCPNSLLLSCNVDIDGQLSGGMVTSPFLSDFGSNKKIRFFASTQLSPVSNFYNEGDGLVVGTMSNPYDQNTFVPFQTIYIDPVAPYGKEYEVDFSSYTGSAGHIAIKIIPIEASYILIDNFRYSDNTCNEPLNVKLASIGANNAIAEWESQITNQNVSVEYGPEGFLPGSGTIVSTIINSAAMENLIPQTDYEFYVTSACTSGAVVQGPFKFKTTCSVAGLPYLESFAGMPAYGQDIVPECYRLIWTGVKSYNAPVLNTTTTPDSMVGGATDNNFLFAKGDMKIITPTFDMVAGTSYSFSVMGRKEYAYNNSTFVRVETGRGNAIFNMETKLSAQNPNFNDLEYKPIKFVFTPLVSGKYAFQARITTGTGSGFFLDDFAVKEGYNSSITNNNASYNFNGGLNDAILLEGTENTTISVAGNVDGYINMGGGINSDIWVDEQNTGGRILFNTNPTELWTKNENFITKINMKVNASNMSGLYMNFKLKQTYATNNEESLFRVVVNGSVIRNVIDPSQAENNYTTYQFNLSPFVGSDIRISLQHLGKSIADKAQVDDINFTETAILANEDNLIGSLKIYPNPATDMVTLYSDDNISSVEILNVSGQQLYNAKYNTNSLTLDISAYSAGMYFIRVHSEGRHKTYKIIKN